MAPPNDTYVDTNGKKASSADEAVIETATNEAIARVDRVIAALKGQVSGPADPYLDRLIFAYFKTNSQQDIKGILQVFQDTKTTLNKNTKYVVDRIGSTVVAWKGNIPKGLKKEHYHGKTGQTSTAQSSLGLEFFNAPPVEQPATIIHEAVHRSSYWSAFSRFRYGPQTNEQYVFDLYPDLSKWSAASYTGVKDWADIYSAFAQGFDGKDYFSKWGGLPSSILVRQMIGPYKDLDKKIIEAKGHLQALGLYSGTMDAKFDDAFSKAMQKFIKDYWKEFTGGGIYSEESDWGNDTRFEQLRRARQKLAPERRPH